MRFRPCIDIHNGAVKQIVGGSLKDEANQAKDNFVSKYNADFYADLYRRKNLTGGHIIILNPKGSEYYEADLRQAELALSAYSGGLMLGGGVNPENAESFLDMGASHVIVTSYVFKDGVLNMDNLKTLTGLIGKERLVLDLSCKKRGDGYYITTDRWQKFTNVCVNAETMDMLADYCCEYLIHAVDVEGKSNGIEEELAKMLGAWGKLDMTYAGGVFCFKDLKKLKDISCDRLDVTIGSALDIFGGKMDFDKVLEVCGQGE